MCGFYCWIVDEVSEDRMIALRKRAELEAKYVVILNPNNDSEFQSSLNRYGFLLGSFMFFFLNL